MEGAKFAAFYLDFRRIFCPKFKNFHICDIYFPWQALSQALLQVRADLVDTAQRTLEGEAARETHEANVKELVEKRTQQLMVCKNTRKFSRFIPVFILLVYNNIIIHRASYRRSEVSLKRSEVTWTSHMPGRRGHWRI